MTSLSFQTAIEKNEAKILLKVREKSWNFEKTAFTIL